MTNLSTTESSAANSATSVQTSTSRQNNKPPTPEKIMQLTWGFAPPLVIHAALKNGIFDSLDRSPKTSVELASELGISERGAAGVVGGLLAVGLAQKQPDGRFRLAPDASAFLVHGKPEFQGGLIEHVQGDLIRSWLDLAEVARTGNPQGPLDRREDNGAEFFERLVPALFPMNYAAARALAASLSYGGSDNGKGPVKVLDVAAGSGVWGIAQAQASPRVHVTALDSESVLAVTKRTVESHQVAGQFDYLPGDMRTVDFGKGYSLVILGHILHSEGVTRSQELLQHCFDALAPSGTVAIAEFLVNAEHTGPPLGLFFAINMLVNTQDGSTFSFEEIGSWLRSIGFTNVRQLEVPGPSPLILADKPA